MLGGMRGGKAQEELQLISADPFGLRSSVPQVCMTQLQMWGEF